MLRPKRIEFEIMAILQKLIEALRNELQQYGEMLALLDHQQELVDQSGADDILHSISAINSQSATIQTAREKRQSIQQQLAQSMNQPDDFTFAQLMPLLPAHYRPLVGALVQENNELLERVRQRAQRNQHLLRRSLELMQRFITTLSPQDQAAAPAVAENPVLAVEAGLPLYDAIV